MKMNINDLLELAKRERPEGDVQGPLYLTFSDTQNAVDRTEVFPTASGVEIALDLNADGVVVGIEFV